MLLELSGGLWSLHCSEVETYLPWGRFRFATTSLGWNNYTAGHRTFFSFVPCPTKPCQYPVPPTNMLLLPASQLLVVLIVVDPEDDSSLFFRLFSCDMDVVSQGEGSGGKELTGTY